MAPNNTTDVAKSEDAVFGDVQRNWGWFLTLGILSLVLGTVGIGMSWGLTIAGILIFGILILVAGLIQLVNAFRCKGRKEILLHLIMAVLYLLTGVMVIAAPMLAAMVFTLMLACLLILVGIIRALMAFELRGFSNRIVPLIGGVVSIVLGLIILAEWPISGLWVIGLFISIELVVNGWSYIFVALAARQAGKAPAGPGRGA
ncbi:MAG: HdeD family acid-resistance protein [Desulfomonilaceae bacterium]|nr:HdeD family acid-resistance protein [Desulfomonilaceae bacterium]